MNYLQLTNDFLIETQMEDTLATLASVQDDTEQAATWIRDAWIEIQRNRDWSFLWAVGVFATTAGKRVYTLPDMGRVSGDRPNMDEFYLLQGTTKMGRFDWHKTIGSYVEGVPSKIGERPDGAIVFNVIPDGVYNIAFEYYSAPQVLLADSDEPQMDPSFHKAIVWKAIENYAREQGNEWKGLYQVAVRSYNAAYHTMLNRYLPKFEGTAGILR